MNIRYTSALLLVANFLASSLLLAVTPHISPRSQGQNIVHTALQRAKTHCAARVTEEETPASLSIKPIPVEIKKTAPHKEQAKNIPSTTATTLKNIKTFFSEPSTPQTYQETPQEKPFTPSQEQLISAEKQEFAPLEKQVTTSNHSATSKTATKKNTPLLSKKKNAPKKLKDTPSTLITPKKSVRKKRPTTRLISSSQDVPAALKPARVKYSSYQKDWVKQEQVETPKHVPNSSVASSKKAGTSSRELVGIETALVIDKQDKSLSSNGISVEKNVAKTPVLENKAVSVTTEQMETVPGKIMPVKTIQTKTISVNEEQKNTLTTLPATTAVSSSEKTEQKLEITAPQTIKNDAAATLNPVVHQSFTRKPSASVPSGTPSQQSVTEINESCTNESYTNESCTNTNWLSRIKKYYQKSVDYVRNLIKEDAKPSIQSISTNQTNKEELVNESFSESTLYKNNAAMEVASIEDAQENPIAGNFALLPEIARSYKPHALARAFFGCDLYNDTTLHIRGSALDRNEDKDWLADYFYLSNKYEGVVCFTPHVTSFSTNMQLFIDLNSWFKGCFVRVQSPLTWTKWDLGMREHVINSGKVTGAHGWKDTWTSVDNRLLSSFTEYSCWEKAGTSYIDAAGLVHPLYNAKMCPCGAAKTALADIHVDFGVYEHKGERYHVGAYARGVMPTGTHSNGEFLCEPVIGNGHHWELGAGFNGYAQLWTDRTKSREVGFYVDCSLTHLLGSHEQRVFDLKNHGPLSRYLLVTNSTSAPASITPAANITRAQVTVSVPVQADLVTLINYANDVFSWNFGYNFWTRSCEKINCCGIAASYVCDNCSATAGLDGITWKPYTNATIKNLGTEALENALTLDDLDLLAARTKGSSHKLFTSLTYSWRELDDTVVPFLGIGAELECGKSSTSSTKNNCCNQSSLSQWGLWLRVGTDF